MFHVQGCLLSDIIELVSMVKSNFKLLLSKKQKNLTLIKLLGEKLHQSKGTIRI